MGFFDRLFAPKGIEVIDKAYCRLNPMDSRCDLRGDPDAWSIVECEKKAAGYSSVNSVGYSCSDEALREVWARVKKNRCRRAPWLIGCGEDFKFTPQAPKKNMGDPQRSDRPARLNGVKRRKSRKKKGGA